MAAIDQEIAEAAPVKPLVVRTRECDRTDAHLPHSWGHTTRPDGWRVSGSGWECSGAGATVAATPATLYR